MTCRFHVYNIIANKFWQLKVPTWCMITGWQIPFGRMQQTFFLKWCTCIWS